MKKILALILTLVMMLSIVACNDDKNQDDPPKKDEKTTYTVTVLDDEGNPVAGVNVTFCPKGGTEMPWPTDAEGKASQKTTKEMTAKLLSDNVPTGYEFDKAGQSLSFDKDGNLTITLTALAPYVIKVVDQEGNAIAGVQVQMCDEAGSCRLPRTTGADGTVSYPFENGTFKAQLTTLPDGYTVDDASAYYYFVEGVATITLTKN